MNNIKNKINIKGITLVALVITIIILLILSGVVIAQLQNNGLFGKSKEAKEKWEVAQVDEDERIDRYTNEIDSYLTGSRKDGDEASSTILYPNGTKDAPASITKGDRIEINNPFPGHNLYLNVELLYNNQWGTTEFTAQNSANDAFGVTAFQLRNDTTDKIVIQAGSAAIIGVSATTGNPFGISSLSSRITTLPYRLIVVCID